MKCLFCEWDVFFVGFDLENGLVFVELCGDTDWFAEAVLHASTHTVGACTASCWVVSEDVVWVCAYCEAVLFWDAFFHEAVARVPCCFDGVVSDLQCFFDFEFDDVFVVALSVAHDESYDLVVWYGSDVALAFIFGFSRVWSV